MTQYKDSKDILEILDSTLLRPDVVDEDIQSCAKTPKNTNSPRSLSTLCK
ncbi:MAG: hypothetical protein GX756_04925 [Clostridiales bacterium]|nr:hypothetical protein [Clostridiales bacterium]